MGTFDQANWHGLVATARSLPLDRVATALGCRRDVRDKACWKRPGSVLSVNGEKFFDHMSRDGRRWRDQPGDARSRWRLPRCRRLPVDARASPAPPGRRGCSGRPAAARPPGPVGGLLARGARSPCHGTRHRRDAAPGLPRPRAGPRGLPRERGLRFPRRQRRAQRAAACPGAGNRPSAAKRAGCRVAWPRRAVVFSDGVFTATGPAQFNC